MIRMNFSHRDHENMERVVGIVRDLNTQKRTKLSLLLDNKGPEIRTGKKAEKTMILLQRKYRNHLKVRFLWISLVLISCKSILEKHPELLSEVRAAYCF